MIKIVLADLKQLNDKIKYIFKIILMGLFNHPNSWQYEYSKIKREANKN